MSGRYPSFLTTPVGRTASYKQQPITASLPMTQNLAAQLSAKLNSTGLQAEVCDLFADPEMVIHDSLVDIGEDAPPPAQPPASVVGLADAIERCFQDGMTSLEILNLCNKAVLG